MPDTERTEQQEFVERQRDRQRFQNGKADIVDVRPFQYERVPLQEAGGEGDYVIKGVLQRADAQNQNGRVYPKHILEREVERYKKEFINKNMAYGELDHPSCFTESAEILSENGWKSFTELGEGEHVCTMNPDTGEVEYQVPTEIVGERYEGLAYEIDHRNLQTTVTPNHRFFLYDRNGNGYFATAQEIFESPKSFGHSRIPKTAKEEFSGTSEGPFNPFGVDDTAFFRFLGIWLADGHTVSSKPEIGITQVKNKGIRKIRNLLASFPEKFDWSELKRENEYSNERIQFVARDRELYQYLRTNFGEDCYTKRIPAFIKSAPADLLSELVEWFQMGDGRDVDSVDDKGRSYNRKEVFSTSERLMNDVQELLLKTGESGEYETTEDYEIGGRTVKARDKSTLHQVHRSTVGSVWTDPRHFDVEKTWHDGTIHCVSVPNEVIYVRDNGKPFWSGNSSTVELKNASHIVRNVWWNGNDVMGEVQVLPTPMGNILRTLLDENLSIGISSRGMGSVEQKRGGKVVVNEDFQLIAWDFVSNPSTHGAFMGEKNLQEAAQQELDGDALEWRPVEQFAQEIISEMSDLAE